MAAVRLMVTLSGRVQGVGFRHFARQRALEMGATGWVRNTTGGEVEVLAEGERPALERLLADLSDGPRFAHVDRVETTWSEATGEFHDFRVTG